MSEAPIIHEIDVQDPRLEPEVAKTPPEDPNADPFLTSVLEFAKAFKFESSKLYEGGVVAPSTKSRLQHLWKVGGLEPTNYEAMAARLNKFLAKKRRDIRMSDYFEPLYIAEKTVLTERSEPYQRALAVAIRLQTHDEHQEEGRLGSHRRDELYTLMVFGINPNAYEEVYEQRIARRLQVRKTIAKVAKNSSVA